MESWHSAESGEAAESGQEKYRQPRTDATEGRTKPCQEKGLGKVGDIWFMQLYVWQHLADCDMWYKH